MLSGEINLKRIFFSQWEKYGAYTHFTNGMILRVKAKSKSHRRCSAYRQAVWSALILTLWAEFVARIFGMMYNWMTIAPKVFGRFTARYAGMKIIGGLQLRNRR